MRVRRAIILLGVLAIALLVVLWPRLRRQPSAPSAVSAWTPIAEQTLSHGRFDKFNVYAPHGTPRGFVILMSGGDGWTLAMSDLALKLAAQGAMVAGIDTPRLAAKFEADPATCVFPDGDLENLSHFVQAYFRLPLYLPPILAGRGPGATLAYAALAQAPANTFGGALSEQFCPTLTLRKPLCKSAGLDFSGTPGAGAVLLPTKQLTNPWIVIDDPAAAGPACSTDAVRAFAAQTPQASLLAPPSDAGFAALIARNAPSAAATSAQQALGDLPLVFVPVQPGVAPSDTFAVMLSGDGGWAGLDKDVADALTADGIAVVGLDSLRYFWSARTPQGLATDLDRIIRYYLTELGKHHVVLIGYSQGADVLPFAVNRLTDAVRAHVVLAAVMGMSEHALFEFHMTSWISDDNSGPATLPEIDRITGMPVLCIYGDQETDTLCPKLDTGKATVVKLKGGHHFDGNYAQLARTILASARR